MRDELQPTWIIITFGVSSASIGFYLLDLVGVTSVILLGWGLLLGVSGLLATFNQGERDI